MNKLLSLGLFLFLFQLVCLPCKSETDNKFIIVENPNCKSLCDNGTFLLYSRLPRNADSLHIFVSVGNGLGDLAVSYLQFDDPKQVASVSWPSIFSSDPLERANALSFSNPRAKLMSKFSFALTSLIEYSDIADDVTIPLSPNNSTRVYPTSSFQWRVKKNATVDRSITTIVLSTNSFFDLVDSEADPTFYAQGDLKNAAGSSLFTANGSLELTVQLSPLTGRAASLPQLQFTGNNTQMELLMLNLVSSLPNARFALESVLLDGALGSTGQQRSQDIQEPFNIDDEFTPGIFHTSNWISQEKEISCFAQWKPVCYKANERSIANSAVVRNANLIKLTPRIAESLNDSFAYAVFNGKLTQLTGARAVNITFGTISDKFYAASNYIVWTVSVGLGEPPCDQLSLLVIIVILCGLGLPFLLMSATAVYLCVRRCREPATDGAVSAYQPINA